MTALQDTPFSADSPRKPPKQSLSLVVRLEFQEVTAALP